MYHKMFPLEIKLMPSYYLSYALLAMSVLAHVCFLVTLGISWFSILCVLMLNIAVLYAIALHALRVLPHAWLGLRIDQHGITLHTRHGVSQRIVVSRSSVVMPFLTVINPKHSFKQALMGKVANSLVLLPDSLQPHDYRCLRVWLLWGSRDDTDTLNDDT